MATKRKFAVIDGDTGAITRPERKVPARIARPTTPRKALAEASRLYRDARMGNLPTDEASRLAYILRTTSDLVERADTEPRIAAIEQRLDRLTNALERSAALRLDPALLADASEGVSEPT